MTRWTYCPDCDGDGRVECWFCGGTGREDEGAPCLQCDGDGAEECAVCEGAGGWYE